jgi:hypothetical protein
MPLSPEQAEHINVVTWFHYQFPELADDFHHFANERKCSIQQGRTLKRMGVKKGVADFFLALPLNGKAGLWIELKVGKNKPTKEQIAFAERKTQRHYAFSFSWGFEQTKEAILSYLLPYRANREGIKLNNGI